MEKGKIMGQDDGIDEAVADIQEKLKLAKIAIYLAGQMPRTGLGWCASCCMIYMGELFADDQVQQQVRDAHQDAARSGQTLMVFTLPERDELQLQPAVTVGPSWAYRIEGNTPSGWEYPDAPVCWTHIKGIPPRMFATPDQNVVPSKLVPGKSYRARREG
jgi:hypothetical protein